MTKHSIKTALRLLTLSCILMETGCCEVGDPDCGLCLAGCDSGAADPGDTETSDATETGEPSDTEEEPAFCGDGEVDPGESCDLGEFLNGVYGSLCSSDCLSEGPRCGDGVLQLNVVQDPPVWEECDDGNLEEGDGCLSDCRLPLSDEACDPPSSREGCAACATQALEGKCAALNACTQDPLCLGFLGCMGTGIGYSTCQPAYQPAFLWNAVLGALLSRDPVACSAECHLGTVF